MENERERDKAKRDEDDRDDAVAAADDTGMIAQQQEINEEEIEAPLDSQ
jgi:hypothetical protein